jgi:hypothetical protein
MVRRSIAGDSNGKIAAWLNSGPVPTSRGCEWKPETVGTVLRGHSLAGYAVEYDRDRSGKKSVKVTGSRPRRIVDADDNDVMITDDPIIDDETWRQLQAALDSRGQHRAERKYGSHQLLRVAYCRAFSDPGLFSEDGTTELRPRRQGPLYGHNRQGRSKTGSHYACQSCGYRVRKDPLETLIENAVLSSVGDPGCCRAWSQTQARSAKGATTSAGGTAPSFNHPPASC